MSKVMIVEDDDSLREIYGIRLTAEGYAVVSAHDGEEALAVAVRERPDLVISDVMMPKISGFDMLDILRSTPETQNIKVIMMTALSSDDQRERGENLGADRYLVKSQVGIEDVINVVHEVLGDRDANGTINTTAPQAADLALGSAMPASGMAAPAPTPEAVNPAPANPAPQMPEMVASAPTAQPVPQIASPAQPQAAPQDFPQAQMPAMQPTQDPVLNSVSQDQAQPPVMPAL